MKRKKQSLKGKEKFKRNIEVFTTKKRKGF